MILSNLIINCKRFYAHFCQFVLVYLNNIPKNYYNFTLNFLKGNFYEVNNYIYLIRMIITFFRYPHRDRFRSPINCGVFQLLVSLVGCSGEFVWAVCSLPYCLDIEVILCCSYQSVL